MADPAEAQVSASASTVPGPLVVIGGHEDKEGERVILKEVARRLDGGPLVLATVASHKPEGYLESYKEAFAPLGVTDIQELYVETREQADSEELVGLLDGAAGVFFSGGDQLRLASMLGHTAVETKVRALHAAGALLAGTSAGAAMMGGTMLVRGSGSATHRIGDLQMGAGLGFLPGAIVDQHFAERGRIGRLLGAVAFNPRLLGIGVDEDTALVVEGQTFRVIGSGGVYVADGSGATHTNIASQKPERALSVHGVKLHLLSAGDSFDLETRRPTAG